MVYLTKFQKLNHLNLVFIGTVLRYTIVREYLSNVRSSLFVVEHQAVIEKMWICNIQIAMKTPTNLPWLSTSAWFPNLLVKTNSHIQHFQVKYPHTTRILIEFASNSPIYQFVNTVTYQLSKDCYALSFVLFKILLFAVSFYFKLFKWIPLTLILWTDIFCFYIYM